MATTLTWVLWAVGALVVMLVVFLRRAHAPVQRLLRIAQATTRKKRDLSIAMGVIGRLDATTARTVVNPARKSALVRIAGVVSTTDTVSGVSGVVGTRLNNSATVAARNALMLHTPSVYQSLPTFATFQDILAVTNIQAVYISASPVQQRRLIESALVAGKHVLCAAPMCSTTKDVRDVLVMSAQLRRVIVEDLPYRFHPIMTRVRELVHSNQLGIIRSIGVAIRWPFYVYTKTAMDELVRRSQGCLSVLGPSGIHAMRTILGCEPTVVKVDPSFYDKKNRIDERIAIEMVFEHFETISNSTLGDPNSLARDGVRVGTNRVTGLLELDLRAWSFLPEATIKILGSECDLTLDNFLWPHLTHQLTVRSKRTGAILTTEQLYGDGASPEEYQLEAFAQEILFKIPTNPDWEDSIKNMTVFDKAAQMGGLLAPGHKRQISEGASTLNLGGLNSPGRGTTAFFRPVGSLTSPRFNNLNFNNPSSPSNVAAANSPSST